MTAVKLDLLAFGVHPDDIELSAGGTLAKYAKSGKMVGMIHLTRGELGTRGSASIRMREAKLAAKILGASVMEDCGMKDGFFVNDEIHQRLLIEKIRLYRPEIVLCNASDDRHPDHGRASKLVSDSCFYSGLSKITTSHQGKKQQAWRPKAVYHYIQDRNLGPDLAIDISGSIKEKMKALKAYESQFYNAGSKEPSTYISGRTFLDSIRARNAETGRIIGVAFAEGFITERYPGVSDLFGLY